MSFFSLMKCGLSVILSGGKPLSCHLHKAIEENNYEKVRILLNWGVSANYDNTPARRCPLSCAAFCGNISIMKLLMSQGASVNKRSELLGITPLFWALYGNNFEAVEFLLNNGASILIQSIDGNTPLHYAALYAPSMVCLLIKHGAVVNSYNNLGNTPLANLIVHGAVRSEDGIAALESLLSAEADPYVFWHSKKYLEKHPVREYLTGDIGYLPHSDEAIKLYDLGCKAWKLTMGLKTHQKRLFSIALKVILTQYRLRGKTDVDVAREVALMMGDSYFESKLKNAISSELYARAYLGECISFQNS